MSKKQKTKIALFLLLLFVFSTGVVLLIPRAKNLVVRVCWANGLEVDYPEFPETPKLTPKTTLSDYVAYFFNFVIFTSGFIILGVLIWSGILYLTSAGDPTRQKDARSRILGGFIGLTIVLSSYLILTMINPQLVVVHITKEGVKIIPPGEPPEIPEQKKEVVIFFQVPSGKIIERIFLDDEARKKLGLTGKLEEKPAEDQEKIPGEEPEEKPAEDSVIAVAQKTKELSKELLDESLKLKELTDACDCETTICDPTSCTALYCPISKACNEIPAQKNKVKEKAEELYQQREKIRESQMFLIAKIFEIKKPAFLMSVLAKETIDYKTMLTEKHFLEERNKEVKNETYPDWKDPGEKIDDSGDDSLYMDLRTGFAERKTRPPAFDPATFYFEKNRKNDVLIEKAKLIDFEKLKSDIEKGLGTKPITDLLTELINKALKG